jgi:hypothetical protein
LLRFARNDTISRNAIYATTGHPQMKAKADTVVLVGCGQMGSAMLRGWLARGAAERFHIVEPAGAPEGTGNAARI